VLESVTGWADGLTDSHWGEVGARMYSGPMPRFQRRTATEGACELWSFTSAYCEEPCSGVCVDTNRCEPWPVTLSAGVLTLEGLAVSPSLVFHKTVGYYSTETMPAELFADDAAVVARATGDQLPAFTASTSGVAPLVPHITNFEITLTPHQDFTLSWTPSVDPLARVRVVLNANNKGHGQPFAAILECEVADQAGHVVIPKSLIDAFPATANWRICAGTDCPRSHIIRYRRGEVTLAGGAVALTVGSDVQFGVIHQP
jgi:hypothetical protein